MTDQKKKPDLRDSIGHGAIKSDTEEHVVGAETRKVPDDGGFRIVSPDPGSVPEGQGTKG